MRRVEYIVIHCTATSQNVTVASILHYWRTVRKWKNPGYHKLIKPNGEVVELLPPERVSNGVKGYNYKAYNISYIGGRYGVDNRTRAQKTALKTEIEKAKQLFPKAKILGHRDLSPDLDGNGILEPHEWLKQCPSFDVAKWLKKVRIDDNR